MDGPAQKRARIEVYGFVIWTLSWVLLCMPSLFVSALLSVPDFLFTCPLSSLSFCLRCDSSSLPHVSSFNHRGQLFIFDSLFSLDPFLLLVSSLRLLSTSVNHLNPRLVSYIAWAFVPDSVWHPLGIYYYPNRYWSYATPLYLFILWVFSIVVYLAYNLINTEPLDSFYTISGTSLSLPFWPIAPYPFLSSS